MKEKKYPSDKKDRFIVRLPEGMHDRISQAAGINGRSMNAEIVNRLEQSFSAGDRESVIGEIKRLLIERDQKIFEDSVDAALKRFLHEVQEPK